MQRHQKFDVDFVMQLFMKAAKVNPNASYYNDTFVFVCRITISFRFNTRMCFQQLLGTNVAYEVVDSLIEEKYSC